jgi:hypothetical protein
MIKRSGVLLVVPNSEDTDKTLCLLPSLKNRIVDRRR